MSFNTFLDLVRFKSIVCLNKKVASLLHDFNLSYAFFDQLFWEKFILLVNIDDIDVAFLISCVQLLLLIVPAKARKDGLIWVHQLVMSFFLALSRFEPLKLLVVADSEY